MNHVTIKTHTDEAHERVGRLLRSAPAYFIQVLDNATSYTVWVNILPVTKVERFLVAGGATDFDVVSS